MKIGLIREEKIPRDKRVAFTPLQCRALLKEFPNVSLVVQPCDYRCFTNEEYKMHAIPLQEDLSDCDILIGVKEVPAKFLMEGKKYLFFSHTIKKQKHNRDLLRNILAKKIQLIDYECLVDKQENRVIGFGRFAGVVGAYNGIMAYGLKYGLFNLKPAHLCHDKKEVFKELERINLPNIKIVVTGGGRVANGAMETLGVLGIRKVTAFEFLNYSFREPVYVQLHSEDYYRAKDGSDFSKSAFHHHPEKYDCHFATGNSFASFCDLLIHCTFWDPKARALFTVEQMRNPKFHISVIADVTCDINGSIPSTTKATTIDDKFYGYNPNTEQIDEAFAPSTITVMSIDNLPCELPRDASDGFGKHLLERVVPFLVGEDDGLIERASITKDGKLMPHFEYLSDYVAD